MISGRTSTPSARRAWASSSARRHCSSSKRAAPGRRPCAHVARQLSEGAAVSGGVAEKAADALLTQPVEQNVGQGRRRPDLPATPEPAHHERNATADQRPPPAPACGRPSPSVAVAHTAICSGRARPDAMSSRTQRRASTASARGEAQETVSADAGAGCGSETSSPANQETSELPRLRQLTRTSRPKAVRSGRQIGATRTTRSSSTDPSTAGANDTRCKAALRRSGGDRIPVGSRRTHARLDRHKIPKPRGFMVAIRQYVVGIPQPG